MMRVLPNGDDVRSGTKAKARHGRLVAAQVKQVQTKGQILLSA